MMLGTTEGRRRRGWQRMRWLDGITDTMYMCLSKLWELVTEREAWRAAIHGVAKSQSDMTEWTELTELKPTYTRFVIWKGEKEVKCEQEMFGCKSAKYTVSQHKIHPVSTTVALSLWDILQPGILAHTKRKDQKRLLSRVIREEGRSWKAECRELKERKIL